MYFGTFFDILTKSDPEAHCLKSDQLADKTPNMQFGTNTGEGILNFPLESEHFCGPNIISPGAVLFWRGMLSAHMSICATDSRAESFWRAWHA